MYTEWNEANYRHQQLLEEAERIRQIKRVQREEKSRERQEEKPRRILNILF